jgi:hypothetical protein
VRLNANGIAVLILAIGLVIGGWLGGSSIYSRVRLSERHVALFDSEAIETDAEVVRLQPRGENDRRLTVHYTYAAGRREHAGSITLRRRRDEPFSRSFVVGERIPVRYLPSEPHESWIDGYGPARQPLWPALVVPAGSIGAAVCLWLFVRRQSSLLTHGRPAPAFVTKVEQKRSDQGSYWKVHYEWTLLSGAKRKGHYRHGKKHPPAVGAMIPIVYDRDNPARHARYPMSFVALRRV